MIHLFNVINKTTAQLFIGFLELDLDPLAERYCVANRKNLEPVWLGPLPNTSPVKLVVPIEYTNKNDLMVIIFDDAGTPSYNMAGNDKVQAQLVDARTVTLNP
ncbi:hypothetical protein [Alishewanella sp. HL-SH06]|uniref:hypothetical protein n=1 Tax=Alishewanella sp. HL-SH06 TaxID=3461144 RepID=UPI0040420EB4